MPTIVDVARLAGVSTSTVSHVLNNTRPVAPNTREQVLHAISETGYQKNVIASSLRKSRTDTIALIVSEAGYPVLDDMMIGVEEEARVARKTVLVAHSGDDPEREASAINAFSERQVDGLLIMPVADSIAISSSSPLHVPTVILDRFINIDIDQVGVENSSAMEELVTHLHHLGHQRICFVARGKPVSTLIQRRDAFEKAVHRYHLESEASCVESQHSEEILKDLRGFLLSDSPPSAIVCANQTSAVLAIQTCNELGLDIPSDISLVTYDEFPFPDLFSPRITAVAQPTLEIGRDAVRLLENRIDNPDSPFERHLITPQVVYRTSTTGTRSSTSD